jgi:prefoldin alpha subunit
MSAKKEDLQKKVMEFQILDSNLKMLQERAEFFNQKLEEVHRAKEAVKDLEKTKPGKALIPLGSGTFAFGNIENCEDLIVGIGSGIAIRSTRANALENLDKRAKEIEGDLNEIIKQITIFVSQIEKTQRDIEEMQK